MSSLSEFAGYLSGDFRNRKSVVVFCKALVLLTMAKVIILWPVVTMSTKYSVISSPSSWLGKMIFFLSILANNYTVWVLTAIVVLLVVIAILPWNYFSAIVFYIILINLFRIIKPMANGTDIVIAGLAFWMIFAGGKPLSKKDPFGRSVQVLAFNGGVLLCQLQIAFIYFHSGWDKLISEPWQTGDAMLHISNIRHMIKPMFIPLLQEGTWNPVLTWFTIVFELLFGVLVWFKRTRLVTLLAGVVFHVLIAIILSLPDFAVMMAVSYLIFLKDEDYEVSHGKHRNHGILNPQN